ncbi:MAG: hypothetical protein HQ541_16905 [Mariniphaga sp.]|nr:hypothetical protein [Mariniphaga sp.]
MYTLTFKKSKSKRYKEALSIAMGLGASENTDAITLEVRGIDILYLYRKLMDLLSIVHKWRGTVAFYKGVKVDPFRFVFQVWNTAWPCSQKKNTENNPLHCNIDNDQKGWGCKHLRSMIRDLTGDGNYEKSNWYWYNYGSFANNGDWILNKEAIFNKLKNEVISRGLDVCPFLDLSMVSNEVYNELPDRIIIDNVTFRAHFAIRYEDGKRKIAAVNIRHISDPVKSQELRRKKVVSGYGRSIFYLANEDVANMPLEVVNKVTELNDKLRLFDKTETLIQVFEDGFCKN